MKITTKNSDSVELEHDIVGVCILNPEALPIVTGILKPDDFSDERYRLTFATLKRMYRDGIPVDIVTLSEEFKARDLFERIGGLSFVTDLVARMTTASTNVVDHYAKILRDRSIRRKLASASKTISTLALNLAKPLPDIMEEADKLLFSAGSNRSSSGLHHVATIMPSLLDELHDATSNKYGYSTGWIDADKILGGLKPGSLNIVAARPSMGKTAFALNIAQFGGKTNAPALFFSLEMPAPQLVKRMLAAESGINLTKILHGNITDEEFTTLQQAAETVSKRNVYFDDSAVLSSNEFFGKCKRFKNLHPDLGLIVVDYLQLMSSGEQASRTTTRNLEVADISRMLKATARETNCPVVALSQLSREAEKRTDKHPQLSDLRDSGAIEQDADTVIMLYREDYYGENENNDLMDSKADIRVAKNRNGATGMFHLTFRRETTRFLNYGADV